MEAVENITLKDAKDHMKALAYIGKVPSGADPISYFEKEIPVIEKILAGMKDGTEKVPKHMTREEAIEWLTGVLAYNRAYLKCFEQAQVQ